MQTQKAVCVTVRKPTNTDSLKTILLNHQDQGVLVAARWDHASRDAEYGETYSQLKHSMHEVPEDEFNDLAAAEAAKQMDCGLEHGWLDDKLGESPYLRQVRDPSRVAYCFRLATLTEDLFDSYARYQGEWYEWVGYWRVIDEETFEVRLFNFIESYLGSTQLTHKINEPKPASAQVNSSLLNSVKLALKAKLRIERIGWQTCNLEPGIPFKGSMVVDDRVFPSCADYFDPNPIPHSFTYTDTPPTHLLEMLRTSGVQLDEQKTLQQWAGYCLTRETKRQKALGLFGPSRSGKGRFMGVIRWLVGEDNYVSKELNKFGNQFALGNLRGKLLCELPDERIDSRHSRVALSRLLKIIGEDAIELEKKGKDSETEKLFCKIVIVSNELPELSDESGAMLNRLLIVETRVSHADNPDEELESKILSQPDEIISWALRGLWSLEEQGFTTPNNNAARKYVEVNSPIRCFINECCELEGSIKKDDLYTAYQMHSEEPVHRAQFFKSLRNVIDYHEERVRQGRERVHIIRGISLKGEQDD